MKGKRSSGHYGAKRHTTKNLEVMRVDTERNLLFIKGAVPGPPNGFVQVRTAKHRHQEGLSEDARSRATSRAASARSRSTRPLRREGPLPHAEGRGRDVPGEPTPGHRQDQDGRGEVKGTNKKPYRQKHTGRARAGDRQVAHLARRRHGLRSAPARLLLPHAGQGAPRGAAHRARRQAGGQRGRDRRAGRVQRQPSAKAARKVLADLGSPHARCVWC